MTLPIGCGEPTTLQDPIPAEFVKKLEKDRPEIFVEKVGKNKTGIMGGREKRAIIHREWLKAQQGNP